MHRSILTLVFLIVGLAPARTASISGVVSDRDTGDPLSCSVVLETATGSWVGSRSCDVDGSYEFDGLEAGDYRLEASAADDYVALFWPDTWFWDEAGTVTLAEGETRDDIDFELFLGARVAGSINELGSGAVLDAWVHLRHPDWRWGRYVRTDASGEWVVTGIPPGSWILRAYEDDEDEQATHVAQYWPGSPDEDDHERIETVGTEHLAGYDFELPVQAVISGVVTEASTGLPLEGAVITASERDYRWGRYAISQADGSYRLRLLAAGDYRLWCEAQDYEDQDLVDEAGQTVFISLAAGDEESGLDWAMRQGGTIEGRLQRQDGSPIEGGWVTAFNDAEAKGGSTDDDGSFSIDGLPAGEYALRARAGSGANLIPGDLLDDNGERILVDVEVGEVASGYVITLLPGATIRGTVRSESGDPLDDFVVYASEIDGPGYRDEFTDADGEYLIDSLADTPHVIAARGAGFVQEYYDNASVYDEATPVTPVIGEVLSGIDFELSAGGSVSGEVVDVNTGLPIERVWVGLFRDQYDYVDGASDVTGADGRFLIEGAPEHDALYVRANDWDTRYALQWYQGAALFAAADTISVLRGELTADIDFALFQSGELGFNPDSFSGTATTSDESVALPDLVVTNLGPGPAAISVWTDVDWLSAEGDFGGVMQSGDFRVASLSIVPRGFAPGSYQGNVVVYDKLLNLPRRIPVSLQLGAGGPELEVEPDQLYWDAFVGQGNVGPERIYLANVGGTGLTATLSSDVSWLAAPEAAYTVTRGEDPIAVDLFADTSGLATGIYEGTLTISSDGGNAAVEVILSVDEDDAGEAEIVAPRTVTAIVDPSDARGTTTTSFEISNAGDANLRFSVAREVPWIVVSPQWDVIAPGESETLTVSIDTSSLEVGMNSTYLEIRSVDDREQVEIGVQISGEIQTASVVEASTEGELIVPVLVHAAGAQGSQFVSDLWVSHRPAPHPVEATLIFIPEGSRAGALSTEVSFDAGATFQLLDVMETWLGGAVAKGSLIIQSDCIDEIEAVSKTYAKTADGTLGQEIPAVSSEQAVDRLGGRLYVPGLERSPSFRSNLLITEVGGDDVVARVRLTNPEGQILGTESYAVPAFGTTQINDVFSGVGAPAGAHSAVRADVSVISGNGEVVTIGSKVDNQTNDPTTLFGVPKGVDVDSVVIPVVANADGLAGTKWRSDVTISNVDVAQRQVEVRYYRSGGSLAGSQDHLIEPGHTLALDDVVASFGAAGSRGSLHVEISPPGGLAMTSRTFNVGPDGTLGQGIQALDQDSATGLGSGVVRLIALTNTPRLRTNIGITEMLGASVRIGLTMVSARGEVLGYRELSIPAFGQFQGNFFQLMGLAGESVHAATAIIQVLAGSGGITAYGSTIDNTTGDATTLPPPQRIGPREENGEGNPVEEEGGEE